jgi:hypothetical protein
MPPAKRRRSRSAKRRAQGRPRAQEAAPDAPAEAARAVVAPARPPVRSERGAAQPTLVSVERPEAPWHPLPLSELVIVAGAGAILFSFANGIVGSEAALLAGLGAVLLGTLEVTLREHLAGYRSHALLLAVLAVVVLHTAIVLVLSSFIAFPRDVNLLLVALDIAVAFVLYRLLRARYADARRRAALARR